MAIKDLAKTAIQIQDASNLRGVLNEWHSSICSPEVVRGGQIEEFLNILYLSKVSALLLAQTDGIGGCYCHNEENDDAVTFGQAYNWAKSVA